MFNECRHVMLSGLHCKSPAMRGSAFCYFHARAQRPTLPGRPREARVEIPVVLGSEGTMRAINQVLQALAAGHISSRRAGSLLYAIQAGQSAQSSCPWEPADDSEQPSDSDGSENANIPPELAAEMDAVLEKFAAYTTRQNSQPAGSLSLKR